MTFADLTIVTSCIHYGKYLPMWAESIVAQTVYPGRVCIFTHGAFDDARAARRIQQYFDAHQVVCDIMHRSEQLNFGTARNHAVAMSSSDWVMHFDADDLLLPYALEEFQEIAPSADVIQAGYICYGAQLRMPNIPRLYQSADGLAALDLHRLASGNSLFRRSLWEQAPYREDLIGAWDTALWIHFAHLGARFRPTTRPVFQYRQHADSVFHSRQRSPAMRDRVSAVLRDMRQGVLT